MIKFILRLGLTAALIIGLKSYYQNHMINAYTDVIDAEFEEYDRDDDRRDEDYAYDDYETETDY